MPYSFQSTEDELDILLGGSGVRAPAPEAAPSVDAAEEQATTSVPVKLDRSSPYFKACDKCHGRGWIASNRTGRNIGSCFKCKGAGGAMLKTTNEERARAAESLEARKARVADGYVDAFGVQYPEELASLRAGAERGSEFAASMIQNIRKWGHLTERQLLAVQGGMERDRVRTAEREAAKAAELARAPIITDKLAAAFEAAHNKGLANPILRFEGFAISEAKRTSANAGALYVKEKGVYLGKIMGGRFLASYDGKQRSGLADKIAEVMVDPVEAAIRYGRETGKCSCCGRTLTDPASVAAGIGPICAENMGW